MKEDIKKNNNSVKLSTIWAICIISVAALICGSFGSEGFKYVAIGIALLSILALWIEGERLSPI